MPSDHTLAYTQRGTSIDGSQLALTNGVLSTPIVEGALCHIDRRIVDTSYYRPYVCP